MGMSYDTRMYSCKSASVGARILSELNTPELSRYLPYRVLDLDEALTALHATAENYSSEVVP